MGEQGSIKSLLFIFWNKRVNVAFISFSHLTVKIDGTPLLVYDSSCSAGEDAAFLLPSAEQVGSLYAAALCLHLHTSPSGSIINMKRPPNAFLWDIKQPEKSGHWTQTQLD